MSPKPPAIICPEVPETTASVSLLPGCVRSLWFSDGNVVLVAEKLKFRVHQSLLCKHSGFFRDLFSLPQPQSTVADSGSDDCLVLELGDRGTDTFFFLTTIYDRSFFSDSSLFSISKEAIAGVIALACKYDSPSLYAEALRRLQKTSPVTLAGLDAMAIDVTPKEQQTQQQRNSRLYRASVHLLGYNPIFLINVARHIQPPELLAFIPYAFYLATFYCSESLTRGVIRTPDRVLCGDVDPTKLTHRHLGPFHGDILFNSDDDAAENDCVRETLHPDDLRRLREGKRALEAIRKEVLRSLYPHRSNISPMCMNKRVAINPCYIAMKRLSREALKEGILTDPNLLARRDRWIDAFCKQKSAEGMMCRACNVHLTLLHHQDRQRLWGDLKKHFDLVNWP